MDKTSGALLFSILAALLSTYLLIGAETALAEEPEAVVIGEDARSGERSTVISMARDLCELAGIMWDDVSMKNLGEGRWRITVISVEQGRTALFEIDARRRIVLKKSFR